MKAVLLLASLLALTACDDVQLPVGHVILYRDGEAKESDVYMIGSRCWVAWYRYIEKVLLRGDGTAIDGSFRYRWTLYRAGPDDIQADRAWFHANCAEPPPPK